MYEYSAASIAINSQAIVSNVLHEAAVYNKDEIIRELYCALEHGEKIIHRENDKLNEMADTRGRRQKLVLLDKARGC